MVNKEKIREKIQSNFSEAALPDVENEDVVINLSETEETACFTFFMQTPSPRHGNRIANAITDNREKWGTYKTLIVESTAMVEDESVVMTTLVGQSKNSIESDFIEIVKNHLKGYDVRVN